MLPEELIADYARIVRRFLSPVGKPGDPEASLKLATTASWLGGYSETCVGALFTDPALTPYEVWETAAHWKTADMTKTERGTYRFGANWGKGRLDDVDLFIPAQAFRQGRWQTRIDSTSLTRGIIELFDPRLTTLTCQVKARIAWLPDTEDDAISYRYFVDLSKAANMSRECFLRATPWKTPSVDLFALVKWEIPHASSEAGVAVPRIRILGRTDVQKAILDREQAFKDKGKGKVKENYSWGSRKVDFDHVFTGRGNLPPVGIDLTAQLEGVARLNLP